MKTTDFWKGESGDEYTERNMEFSVADNIAFFADATRRIEPIRSCIEFGCNIGLNLLALESLYPNTSLLGVDVNATALDICSETLSHSDLFLDSILSFDRICADMAFTKGVLIHIDPDELDKAYDTLYRNARKYILIAEYYSKTPTMIPYRGQDNLLWKRDFAGEMMDKYKDLKLVDYGFWYHKDKHFQDDLNWFLMKKETV